MIPAHPHRSLKIPIVNGYRKTPISDGVTKDTHTGMTFGTGLRLRLNIEGIICLRLPLKVEEIKLNLSDSRPMADLEAKDH